MCELSNKKKEHTFFLQRAQIKHDHKTRLMSIKNRAYKHKLTQNNAHMETTRIEISLRSTYSIHHICIAKVTKKTQVHKCIKVKKYCKITSMIAERGCWRDLYAFVVNAELIMRWKFVCGHWLPCAVCVIQWCAYIHNTLYTFLGTRRPFQDTKTLKRIIVWSIWVPIQNQKKMVQISSREFYLQQIIHCFYPV